MRLPSTNPVSPGYGYGSIKPPYSAGKPHAGTDFTHSPDIYWYAPEQVRVIAKQWSVTCGNLIDFISLDLRRKYRACHSSAVYHQVEQVVPEGEKMGRMGETGEAYGIHLHFVMWTRNNIQEEWVRVDPLATINKLKGEKMLTDESIKRVFMAAGASEADASKVDFGYYRANPDKLGPEVYNSSWNHSFRVHAMQGGSLAGKLEQVKSIVNE